MVVRDVREILCNLQTSTQKIVFDKLGIGFGHALALHVKVKRGSFAVLRVEPTIQGAFHDFGAVAEQPMGDGVCAQGERICHGVIVALKLGKSLNGGVMFPEGARERQGFVFALVFVSGLNEGGTCNGPIVHGGYDEIEVFTCDIFWVGSLEDKTGGHDEVGRVVRHPLQEKGTVVDERKTEHDIWFHIAPDVADGQLS